MNLRDIERAIERDQAMTARVLDHQLELLRAQQEVRSIGQAVAFRLDTVKSLCSDSAS